MKFFCISAWLGALILFVCEAAPAQSREIVRLHALLRDSSRDVRSDTAYADDLNLLARAYYGNNADSAFFYGHKALEYSGRTGYRRGEADGWRMLGNTYEMTGDYVNMLTAYQHSLDIATQIDNTTLIAKVDINMALFYKQAGELDQAQKLMEKVESLDKRSGDSIQFAYVASNLADLALRQHHYDQALEYAVRALQAARKAGDEKTAASYNNDIGQILADKGDYNGALGHYLQSMTYYREADDRLGMTATNSLLGQAYLLLKDYPKALRYAEEALTVARELRRKMEIEVSAKVLADTYAAKGDYRNALSYFQLYKEYSDSLVSDQSSKAILTRAAQYNYDEQASRLREAQALKDAGYERALRKDALKIAVTVSVVAVLTLLAFLLQRDRAANRRTNLLLREKNEKIEEQKEVLEQQAVQLLLNNQQKDRLFSVVAHDLGGPLNSLKGMLDFLKEKKLSELELSGMMMELRRHVDSSSELVSNLLYWASSQLNVAVVMPVLLPVDELVQETIELFAHAAREKEVSLACDISAQLVGYADKDMMLVVLRNLTSNAIKFSRRGGLVKISGLRKAAEIEICVKDTGIGINAADLERIRRKESFTNYGTGNEKGTGLGILLCHEFAEANKGRFFVDSQWGKGSRCYFTIPAAPSSSSISV